MNDLGCFTAKNVTGYLAYNTLAGNRTSFEKTFLLMTHARFKILKHVFLENEARLVVVNLALKISFPKNRPLKVYGILKTGRGVPGSECRGLWKGLGTGVCGRHGVTGSK